MECPHGCGRKFPDADKCKEHVQRRHQLKPPTGTSIYDQLKQRKLLKPLQQQVVMPTTLPTTIEPSRVKLKFTGRPILRASSKNEPKQVKFIEPPPQVTSAELLESKSLITKKLIQKCSGCQALSEATHLNLSEQNLLVFESTTQVPFEQFNSLSSITLQKNRLINVIGIGQLNNLIDLNLSYNRITSLQPLSNCKLLQRLHASHNLIGQLDLGLMVHMRLLHVGHNQLTEFDEVLQCIKHMPSLKDLEIEDNPCIQEQHKYKILWASFIETLDHQVVTEEDYNLAQEIGGQSSQRPCSAPVAFEQDDELEELYDMNQTLLERVDKLEEQNIELRREAERVPFLTEQLAEMKNKVSAYESLLFYKDCPERELRQEIYRLTMELEKHIQVSDKENNGLQNTCTTSMIKLDISQNESSDNDDDNDDKYFQDDDNYADQQGQEIMDLIMRNSMSMSKLKEDFKSLM